jgi:hypothetical protein
MERKRKEWLEKSLEILEKKMTKRGADFVALELEMEKRKSLFNSFKKSHQAPPISKQSITGQYHVVGNHADNNFKGYEGLLSLFYEEDQIRATWQIEKEEVHSGYGMIFSNVLCLNFSYEVKEVLFHGIVAYEFLSDDTISGIWTEQIIESLGVEFGRKLSSFDQQANSFHKTTANQTLK